VSEQNQISTFKGELFQPRFESDWESYILYDLAEWVNGLAFSNIHFAPTGKPVIKIAEIKNGISPQTKFTKGEYDPIYYVTKGDMLFSWSGQPETSIDVFWWRGPDGWLNQHIFKIYSGESCDKLYFFYLLKYLKPSFVRIARNKQTTGLGHVTKKDLRNIIVRMPPKTSQQAIAHILGTLDDKIELNRQMNETLEKMAQTMFKSWFVDFDPVIDKALAAGNPIPPELQEKAAHRKALGNRRKPLPPDIARLFPDSFANSELGPIPKGWNLDTIGKSVEKISKGTTPTKKDINSAEDPALVKFLKVKDISENGKINIDNLQRIPKSIHEKTLRRSILKKDDILFTIAGTIGRVTVVPKELDNSNTNQAVAFIRPKIDGLPSDFLYLIFKTKKIQHDARSRIVQGVQANVSLTVLSELKFPFPPPLVLKTWNDNFNYIFRKKESNTRVNRTATAIRDSLLPKLLSGELKVNTAEKEMEKIL